MTLFNVRQRKLITRLLRNKRVVWVSSLDRRFDLFLKQTGWTAELQAVCRTVKSLLGSASLFSWRLSRASMIYRVAGWRNGNRQHLHQNPTHSSGHIVIWSIQTEDDAHVTQNTIFNYVRKLVMYDFHNFGENYGSVKRMPLDIN